MKSQRPDLDRPRTEPKTRARTPRKEPKQGKAKYATADTVTTTKKGERQKERGEKGKGRHRRAGAANLLKDKLDALEDDRDVGGIEAKRRLQLDLLVGGKRLLLGQVELLGNLA